MGAMMEVSVTLKDEDIADDRGLSGAQALTPRVESSFIILTRPFRRRRPMAWKKPRIVEIAVGMEINSYACADLKK